MTDMKELVETMRANEHIARRLFDIENQVLACENSEELFKVLLTLLKEKFELGNVYLLFNQTEFDQLYHVHLQHQPAFLLHNENIHFYSAEKLQHYLINGNIRLTNQINDVRGLLSDDIILQYQSFACIPLNYEEKLLASLLFVDKSPERYHQGLGCFHLEQLAQRVSLAMNNVISREKLEFLASHDPLTGIKNRRSLEATIRSEISRYKRYGTPFSLMFIDCNKFKPINDTYGHACGDAVLQFIAKSLTELTRNSDEVFRFAGDEFVVTLSNQTLKQAEQVAVRFSSFFKQASCQFQGHTIYPTISCGVAQCIEGESGDSLLKRADQELYRQKKNPNER